MQCLTFNLKIIYILTVINIIYRIYILYIQFVVYKFLSHYDYTEVG